MMSEIITGPSHAFQQRSHGTPNIFYVSAYKHAFNFVIKHFTIYYSLFTIDYSPQKCQPKIAINVTSNKLIMLMGNKYFHSRFNNWSILNLGNVHLNHMMTNIRKNVLPKNHKLDGT